MRNHAKLVASLAGAAGFIASLAAPGLHAQAVIPGTSPTDAGEAATIGLLACGIPSSRIDAFMHGIEHYAPGATHSPEFLGGQAAARQALSDIQQAGSTQDEIRQTRCPDIETLVNRFSRVR